MDTAASISDDYDVCIKFVADKYMSAGDQVVVCMMGVGMGISDDSDVCIKFVADKYMSAGDQVTCDMYPNVTCDLCPNVTVTVSLCDLMYHGFVLSDNPDEDIILFDDVEELVQWCCSQGSHGAVPSAAEMRSIVEDSLKVSMYALEAANVAERQSQVQTARLDDVDALALQACRATKMSSADRVLRSFRLHSQSWGTSSESPEV
eukprot:gene7554-704_t